MRIFTIVLEINFGPVPTELSDILLTQDNCQAGKTVLIQFDVFVYNLRNLVLDLRDDISGRIRETEPKVSAVTAWKWLIS